ncbi:MAG: hypothetical protein K8S15_05160 [Candidatus Aegiribacteria sp.]|nr:hypothetical protein [Candidatus Aegiribacteria sp.]
MMKLPQPTDTAQTRVFASILLFLIPFSIYIAGFRYIGSGDTVASELLAVSLVREGNFDFNEFFDEGEKMPYAFTFSGDRIVNLYTVIPGMMHVPVFFAANIVGIDLEENLLKLNKISLSFFASISVVLMFYILLGLGFSIRRSFFLCLVYAFGTLVWSQAARGTWQHGPSILFLCSAILLMQSDKKSVFAWAGFFLSLICVNRPANVFIVLPIYIYILVHKRDRFFAVVLTSLIPLAFLAWYSIEYWGSILSLGQGQNSKFTGNPLLGIPGMLISPARGLLVFSSVFVFSIIYMVRDVFRKGGDVFDRYLTAGFILTLICYSFWERWSGGHCFGYRYLTEFIPILTIFLAKSWDRYIAPRRCIKVIFIIMFAASVYINFLGAIVFPSGFDHIPNDVDFHPERLWHVYDTEIVRCHNLLVDRIASYF